MFKIECIDYYILHRTAVNVFIKAQIVLIEGERWE